MFFIHYNLLLWLIKRPIQYLIIKYFKIKNFLNFNKNQQIQAKH
ncbi:hypothetical protein BBUWI9123_F0020 (plasmid) [Borreliella burgdorferi WI91-23]|nr:hypothetical protein BBUWI9123_F0020 [Borreliella burgdorferi WI91-23]